MMRAILTKNDHSIVFRSHDRPCSAAGLLVYTQLSLGPAAHCACGALDKRNRNLQKGRFRSGSCSAAIMYYAPLRVRLYNGKGNSFVRSNRHEPVFVFIYCFIVAFSPGPSNIVILSSVQNSGMKKTLRYIAGASIAFLINRRFRGVGPAAVYRYADYSANLANRRLPVHAVSHVSGLYHGRIQVRDESNGVLYVRVSDAVSESEGGIVHADGHSQLRDAVLYGRPVVSAFVVAVSLIGLSAYMTWAVCGSLFKELCKNIGGRPTRSWLCFCCIRRLSYPAYRSS